MHTTPSCSVCKLYTQFPENPISQINISAGRSSLMHIDCAKAIFTIPLTQKINTHSLSDQDCRACRILENRYLQSVKTNIRNPLFVFTLIGKMPFNRLSPLDTQTPESIALGKTKSKVVTAIGNGVLHRSCAREIFNLGPTLEYKPLPHHHEIQNISEESFSHQTTYTQNSQANEENEIEYFNIDDWLVNSIYPNK